MKNAVDPSIPLPAIIRLVTRKSITPPDERRHGIRKTENQHRHAEQQRVAARQPEDERNRQREQNLPPRLPLHAAKHLAELVFDRRKPAHRRQRHYGNRCQQPDRQRASEQPGERKADQPHAHVHGFAREFRVHPGATLCRPSRQHQPAERRQHPDHAQPRRDHPTTSSTTNRL